MGHIRITRDGVVATITLDRPTKRNALTADMWADLGAAVTSLADDDATTVIVITGTGGHFCAGADIASFVDIVSHPDGPMATERIIAECPKPTIAAIDGSCVGGGVQIATACDLRIATARARFGVTPAKLGYLYPHTALRRLVRLVGPAQAKRLVFTSDIIDADDALRMGLITDLVPNDDLADDTRRLASTIAARSQLSVHGAKAHINALVDGRLDDDLLSHWDDIVHDADDLAEGIDAFTTKRTPHFSWRPGGR